MIRYTGGMVYRQADSAQAELERSILVVGVNGHVVGLSRSDGSVVWDNDLAGGGYGPVYIALRYGVLAASADGKALFRLDYATGQEIWAAETRARGRATILIEPDLITCAKGEFVHCFDHDGNERWRRKLPHYAPATASLSLAFPGNLAQSDESGLS